MFETHVTEADKRLLIVAIKEGKRSYYLTAGVTANGDLELAGQDLGGFPIGDEYEYWYRVAAAERPRVLALLRHKRQEAGIRVSERDPTDTGFLALLRDLLRPEGIAASTKFKEWLEAADIPYRFHNHF